MATIFNWLKPIGLVKELDRDFTPYNLCENVVNTISMQEDSPPLALLAHAIVNIFVTFERPSKMLSMLILKGYIFFENLSQPLIQYKY